MSSKLKIINIFCFFFTEFNINSNLSIKTYQLFLKELNISYQTYTCETYIYIYMCVCLCVFVCVYFCMFLLMKLYYQLRGVSNGLFSPIFHQNLYAHHLYVVRVTLFPQKHFLLKYKFLSSANYLNSRRSNSFRPPLCRHTKGQI